MDSYVKEHHRLLRKMDREDLKNRLLRPFRLTWQTLRMMWSVWRRREFDRSMDLDHLIMCSGDAAACRRYTAWVQRFRDRAHHRRL